MSVPLIFLVEDDPNDEEFTRLALSERGVQHVLEVARDGAEALVRLRDAGAGERVPALILLDLKVPKIDGVELLKCLRGHPRTRYVPMVVFTSSSERCDLRASYENGASAFVRKPVAFEAFTSAVNDIASFWLTSNEPYPGPEPT